MWEDYQADDCSILKNVQWELTSYEKTGPVLEHHFGWQMTIFFKAYKPAFNADKWNIS